MLTHNAGEEKRLRLYSCGFLHLLDGYDAILSRRCQVEKRIFRGFFVINPAKTAILQRIQCEFTGEKLIQRNLAVSAEFFSFMSDSPFHTTSPG